MAKRKISENSLKNLETEKYKFSKNCPEIAQKNQKKSVEKRKQNKEEKIARAEGLDYIWDNFFKPSQLEELWQDLSAKDKADILKRILPQDKQVQELSGEIGIQKYFVTQEELNAADNYIDKITKKG